MLSAPESSEGFGAQSGSPAVGSLGLSGALARPKEGGACKRAGKYWIMLKFRAWEMAYLSFRIIIGPTRGLRFTQMTAWWCEMESSCG